MADDLEELLDHLSLDCINLIGHSMGGKTAMTFANSNPDRISRLVVADIGPKLYPVHHQEIIDAFYSVPINSIKSRKEADELLQPKVVKFGVRQFLLKNLARTSGGFEWKMNLDTISNNISEVGASTFPNTVLDIETLFIRGSKSNYILDDDLEGIKASYSSAQFETIIGAGHWLHAECPKEFSLASYDFLTLLLEPIYEENAVIRFSIE